MLTGPPVNPLFLRKKEQQLANHPPTFQRLLVIASAVAVLTGCVIDSVRPCMTMSLGSLPSIQRINYRVDPYIEAAMELQAAGKKAAFQQLLVLARSSEGSDFEGRQKIAVLCRMLFTQRPGFGFERPALGGPSFIGDYQAFALGDPVFKKWSLEPIELVDGVPFSVVTGYAYEGSWDPRGTESYVRYCMKECNWSNVRFTTKSKKQKEIALEKLLSSPKWQPPLGAQDKELLTKQID